MKTCMDCVPCFVRQTITALRMVTGDPATQQSVLREALGAFAGMSFDRPPAEMGGDIHRLIRRATGVPDPYREIKDRFNRLALGMYPELKRIVERSKDRFATAVRLSIAGNVIDFGIGGGIEVGEVRQAVDASLAAPLAIDATADLREAVFRAQRILYVGDNAGEVVFDRVLIEEMPRERITFAVRGSPTINDATLEDAEFAGLTGLVRVIGNGLDLPGTVMDRCSGEFRDAFAAADLVLAKGQGNYETLSEHRVFFLLKVKCATVAADLGLKLGDMVVMRNEARPSR